MNTIQFVTAVYLKAERKIPTCVSGSSKWNVILGIANGKIDTWMTEPGTNWNSLYNPEYAVGNISTASTYDLDDEIRIISSAPGDYIVIVHVNGNTTDFETVDADALKQHTSGNYCAKIGRTLVFNRTFKTTDPEYGGSIKVPGYLYASHLVNDTDEVPVDDAEWLVTATAAEYNRGDIVKQNQYANLVNEANALMEAMKVANSAQVEYIPMSWSAGGATW